MPTMNRLRNCVTPADGKAFRVAYRSFDLRCCQKTGYASFYDRQRFSPLRPNYFTQALFTAMSTAEYQHDGPAAFDLQQGLSTLLFKTHESVAHIAAFTVEIQLGEMD
jgi:hypothetical protein